MYGYKPRYKRKMPMRRRTYRKKASGTLKGLQKAVRTLQKKTRTITERDIYSQGSATDVIEPFAAVNFTALGTWSKVWSNTTVASGQAKSKCYHRSFSIDNNITLDNINNEEGEIQFTYFVISGRDISGPVSLTSGVPNLVNNIDFCRTGGRVFMNLKRWKVHYVRRFTLTGGDGTDMQADRALVRFHHTVKVGNLIENPDGDWRALDYPADPSHTFFAVLFNDNISTDLENPRWSYQVIHSVDN